MSFSPSSLGTSQPGTVSGSVVAAIVPSSETRMSVSRSMCSTCLASVEEGVDVLAGGGAPGAVLVLPDDVDLLARIAVKRSSVRSLAPWTRARRVVVGVVLPGQGGAHPDDHDGGGDPGETMRPGGGGRRGRRDVRDDGSSVGHPFRGHGSATTTGPVRGHWGRRRIEGAGSRTRRCGDSSPGRSVRVGIGSADDAPGHPEGAARFLRLEVGSGWRGGRRRSPAGTAGMDRNVMASSRPGLRHQPPIRPGRWGNPPSPRQVGDVRLSRCAGCSGD